MDDDDRVYLDHVREYNEDFDVRLETEANGRLVVVALNEGGHNGTRVDLVDLLDWLRRNRPDLLEVHYGDH